MIPVIWLAAGAAAMYFFDPEQGNRRRALMRDKMAWLRDEYGGVIEMGEGKAEHLRNRAKGLMHETRTKIEGAIDPKMDSGMGGTTDTSAAADSTAKISDIDSQRAA